MKAKVIGAGFQGEAIAFALEQLGFNKVIITDADKTKASEVVERLDNSRITQSLDNHINKTYDIVVSAAPWDANFEIAKACADAGVKYCDLGGNPEASKTIQENAKIHGSSVFTDLGLAPGWISIIAEEMLNGRYKNSSVELMVGGLPEFPNPCVLVNYPRKLRYAIVFSPKGVYNEYTGMCHTLKDGRVYREFALDGLVNVRTSLGELEAFCTKGGLGLSLEELQRKGVKNLSYKTLRYRGHRACIKFLLSECKLTCEQFKEILRQACPETKDDLIIIRANIKWSDSSKVFERIIYADDRWTAMQKATAFPAAVVATLMAHNKLKVVNPQNWVYEYCDVPFDRFNELLTQLPM